MALRNFWLETEIDGRKTKLKGGPKSRTGGMRTKVYVRNRGASVLAYEIVCKEYKDELVIMICDKDDQLVCSNVTKR